MPRKFALKASKFINDSQISFKHYKNKGKI